MWHDGEQGRTNDFAELRCSTETNHVPGRTDLFAGTKGRTGMAKNNLFVLSLLIGGIVFSGCVDEPESAPVKNALENMEAISNTSTPPPPPSQTTDSDVSDVPTSGEFEVEFTTKHGKFIVAVNRSWAPRGAERFYQLVKSGFYDGAGFFRVVPDFMVQFGIAADPGVHAKWGASIPDDPVKESNKRGYMTFATSGPNSRTSQVFINFKDNGFLDGQGFSPFGKVIKGMEIVDKISSAHGEEPKQHMIEASGDSYLRANFPNLDYVTSAKLVIDEEAGEIEGPTDAAGQEDSSDPASSEQTE